MSPGKSSRQPVVPYDVDMPDGRTVRVHIVPLESGSIICDSKGRALSMLQPGQEIVMEDIIRVMDWREDA